jgi:hypothetical protein
VVAGDGGFGRSRTAVDAVSSSDGKDINTWGTVESHFLFSPLRFVFHSYLINYSIRWWLMWWLTLCGTAPAAAIIGTIVRFRSVLIALDTPVF